MEADLQRTSERTRAANADGLHDVLRAVGDLTADEAQARCLPVVAAGRILAELEKERRAVRMRIGGEERWIAAEDAGLYRDALGRGAAGRAAGGLPRGGRGAAHAARAPLRAHARPVHDARGLGALRGRLRPGAARARAGGRPRPRRAAAGGQRARVVRPRGAAAPAPSVARDAPQGGRAAEQRALARFLPEWQGVDRAPPGGAGVDRLREMLVPLQGLALAPQVWERDVLPRRVGAYSPAWLDQLCASGELVWVGAGALGRNSGRVALLFREDARWLGPPPFKGEPPSEPLHDAIRERLEQGAAFWTDLLADLDAGSSPAELQEALWDLAWAGEVTNDAFAAAARAEAVGREGRPPGGRRFARRRRPGAPQVQGRWSLTGAAVRGRAVARPAMRAISELLLERHGIVTREAVPGRGDPGGFAGLYSGAGEPRDARHRPARLLRRGPRRRAVRAAGRDRAPARPARRRARRGAGAGGHRPRPTRTGPRSRGRSARTTTRTGARPACRAPTW